MNENLPVELSTSIHKQYPKHLKVELKSQDINNHVFELAFKDIELDATYTVVILSVFEEAQTEIKSMATIQNGKAYFTFDTKLITGDDKVTNYVYLKHGAESSDVTSFSFKVALSQIDEGAKEVAQYYDFHYETLLDSFEQELNDYMTKLPEHVVINDETIDLTVYAKKSDLPDPTQFVKWSDMPELQEDKDTIYDDTEVRAEVAKKQDKLKAGSNIIINTIDNTISAIDTVPDLTPYARKADLPDLSPFATKKELPDTSKFLTEADLPEVEGYDDTLIKGEVAKKQDKLIAGENIDIQGNTISATVPDVENYDDTAIRQEIATKQDELIAGENVTIENNVITAKDTIQDLTPYALKEELPDTSQFITADDIPEDKDTIYTAGENIVIDENNVISSTASGGEELEWVIGTLNNGWNNTSSVYPFSYAKDKDDYLHIKGDIYTSGRDFFPESIASIADGYSPIGDRNAIFTSAVATKGIPLSKNAETQHIRIMRNSNGVGALSTSGSTVSSGSSGVPKHESRIYFNNVKVYIGDIFANK